MKIWNLMTVVAWKSKDTSLLSIKCGFIDRKPKRTNTFNIINSDRTAYHEFYLYLSTHEIGMQCIIFGV